MTPGTVEYARNQVVQLARTCARCRWYERRGIIKLMRRWCDELDRLERPYRLAEAEKAFREMSAA